MPYFRYKAVDINNREKIGMIQAASAEVAANVLADQNLTILSLGEEKISPWERSLKFLNRIKVKDLVVFSRQLSVIISASIPLVPGLKILISQTENPALKSVVSEVADEVEGGAKLSSALTRHHDVFSDFFINLIKSGETSGKLDEVLNYLADQQEKDYDLISKIRGAMIYPGFIIGGLTVVGALMMIFVIPQLTAVLQESGVALPVSTRILIGTSDFLARFWWLLLLIFISLIGALRILINKPKGRKIWDNFKLRLPICRKAQFTAFLT